jgi:two-component sensor histidine kinase
MSLATIASTFGALSALEGKVAVHWQLAKSGERRRFRMIWRESGGPMVAEPKHWGFGRHVIQHLMAQALAEKVTHEFLPQVDTRHPICICHQHSHRPRKRTSAA